MKHLLPYLSGLILAAFGASGIAFAADKPNIVFLFSDDQTERALGCYGNNDIITPPPRPARR